MICRVWTGPSIAKDFADFKILLGMLDGDGLVESCHVSQRVVQCIDFVYQMKGLLLEPNFLLASVCLSFQT